MGVNATVLILSLYGGFEGSKCSPKDLFSPGGETGGPRLGDGCASSRPLSHTRASAPRPSFATQSYFFNENLKQFLRLSLATLTVLMGSISGACADFNLNEDSPSKVNTKSNEGSTDLQGLRITL